jgi:hypothetical protein
MSRFAKFLELYKCVALTLIAAVLICSVYSRKRPIRVYVVGGSVDVDVQGTPDVHVTNTVDVDGSVRIQR